MKLYRKLGFYLPLFMLAPLCLNAQERVTPGKPETKSMKIEFNGERIKGIYNIIDTRTNEEKAEDEKRGTLAGSIIVFLTGHAQRPADAWKFSNDMALKSRSGIVIVPVCDTPYGKIAEWRGDKGKDVVLMEMVRHILVDRNISVNGYKPVTDLPVTINGKEIGLPDSGVPASIATVGWSHGGILARRLASCYPDTIDEMGQVCPAGYKKWKHGRLSLVTDFLGESLRIATKLFSKQAPDIMGASFGIMHGLFADGMRGFGSGIIHLAPGRIFRPMKDLKECTVYNDDSNLPLGKMKNIIVIFAKNDTVFDHKQTGVADPNNPKREEIEKFWQIFYPSILDQDCKPHLEFLVGNHLAPVPFHEEYSTAMLKGLGQFVEDSQ